MTVLLLLALALTVLLGLLVFMLSSVYLWSADTARRGRAWRLLTAALPTLLNHRARE
ncbi:hypothetical protein OIE43_05505 [Streptomyces pseudovenezuelae]|uniref:hypothetical protein n=1 Tax=Streptomyces TaxID=1883 RepID=UPI000AC14E3F|nr:MULTISPECIES: hypothetical protein [Streptomyces]WUA86847.1 hypothetical protein OHO81_05925 [Streptomyces pseudovenezuelae]